MSKSTSKTVTKTTKQSTPTLSSEAPDKMIELVRFLAKRDAEIDYAASMGVKS
jgi:hypothetical protein